MFDYTTNTYYFDCKFNNISIDILSFTYIVYTEPQ